MSDSIFNALKRHESFSNKVQVEASPTTPRGSHSSSTNNLAAMYAISTNQSPRNGSTSTSNSNSNSSSSLDTATTTTDNNNSAGTTPVALKKPPVPLMNFLSLDKVVNQQQESEEKVVVTPSGEELVSKKEETSSSEQQQQQEQPTTTTATVESTEHVDNSSSSSLKIQQQQPVELSQQAEEETKTSSPTTTNTDTNATTDTTGTEDDKKDIAVTAAITSSTTTQTRTLKDFKIVKKIGGGNEGAVFSAELKNPLEGEDSNVAIKLVVCEDPEEIETARKDLQFLLTLQQENIVKHHYIFEEKKKGSMVEQTRFYIVMEYCIDGSLELEISRRQREQRPFETDIIKSWTKQICKCMEYMHSQKIAHRDIKPDNILLTKNKQMIKVCDFGFTRKDEKLMNTVMGTMKYIAPEILESKRYDEAVDIWSLGILLFQLMCMISQSEIPDLINEIRNNPEYIIQRFKEQDEVLVRIIDRCLKIDPVDRPEAKEIISDLDKEISELIPPKTEQITPSTPSKEEAFIDNDVKELASLLGQLERARLMKIRDPLKSIELDKAREFWKQSGWAEMKEVTWANFRQAYQEYLDFDRIPKNAERGFKKMITANQGFDVDIVDDERTGVVTVLSYNNLVRKAGFPFNLDVLNLIQNCLVIGESNWDIEEYLKPLSEQAYETAEGQYLDMILQNERLFVEPISQETLYVDTHCVPLHIIQHGKNWVDELIGTGSSNNANSATATTTQASDDKKEFDNERRIHAIEEFAEELTNGTRDEKSDYEESVKNIFHEDGADFISSLPTNNLRFLLTSNASSGKTCMLKIVVTRFIKKKIEQRKSSQASSNCADRLLIPLYIPAGIFASLRNADADFRLKCIRASAGASMQNTANGNSVRYVNLLEHYLMTAMKEQRILFIFDGIDEIASPQQKKRLLQSLVEQFPPPDEISNSNGLMVTTRLGGIEADSKTRKFFSSFIAATLDNLTFDIEKKMALKRNVSDGAFFSAIKGKYRELAKNPLLLSLIIQEYKTNGSLPEVRSKIYQNALQTITRLHYTKLVSDQQKVNRMQITLIEFLRKVSIFLHKLRRHTFSSQDFTNSIEVAKKLSLNNTNDGGIFVSASENDLVSKGDDWIFHAVSNGEFQNQWKVLQPRIDSGKFPLIMACGDGKYRFSHTSFQQYLVASHWANTSVVSDFRVRATGPFSKNKLEFFKERIQHFIVDPFYTETFLFCASEMPKSDFEDFIKLIMKLFKKDLSSVDSVIYNMIMERPKSEHQEYLKIMKQLKTDENVVMIVQGLIHQSEDLRNKAISRSFMYNQLFEKIGDGLLQYVETNEYAIHALSIIIPRGEQKFVSILIKKLEEIKDINIRKRLCSCIGKLSDRGDKTVISVLSNIINNTPKGPSNKAFVPLIESAIEAITKVAEKEDSTIINMLIPLLNDYNFRKVACIGLGSIAKYGDPVVISELTKVSNKCYEACTCLGKLAEKGDMEIIDTLIDCLKESSFDDMIVSEAFSAVVIPDLLPVIQYRLLNMLENERKSIAYRVAMALGSISQRKDPSLVSKLLQMLKTSAQPDRIICALGYSAPKEDEIVISALLEQLGNKSSKDVNREQSAIALAQIAKKGDQKIIESLCKRLLSESEEVITSCTTALEKISHSNNQAVIDTYVQLLKHTDIGVVEVSVRLLGRKSERGSEKIVQHLMERLENREVPEVIRALCAESLGYVANYNDEKVVQSLLLRIIEEGRAMVILRLHAIKAIGMLKSERVNDSVVSTLFDYILTLSSNDDVDTRKFILHAVFVLSLFCDINSMIDRLRNKAYKAQKHIIFDILVKAIRFIRLSDKSFRLDSSSVDLLQKQDDLEASFIFIENSSLVEDVDEL